MISLYLKSYEENETDTELNKRHSNLYCQMNF